MRNPHTLPLEERMTVVGLTALSIKLALGMLSSRAYQIIFLSLPVGQGFLKQLAQNCPK